MKSRRVTLVAVAAAALVAVLVWWLIVPPTPPSVDSNSPADVASPAAPPARMPDGAAVAVVSAPDAAVAAESDEIPQVSRRQPAAAELDLWQLDPSSPDALFDGTPAKRLHAEPEAIGNLRVGQILSLHIPQRDDSVRAEIIATANLTPRTQVWEGAIIDGQPLDNVVVARGQTETHVTILTGGGSYMAVIDNVTGEALLVDEADITEDQIPFEDGIAVEPILHQHPPATR